MSRDALIVGINTYKTLPPLNAPANDAEAIALRLHTQGEFRVHRMPEIIENGQPTIGVRTPVTTRALEEALIRLFKPNGKNIPQTALFYFSGHGFQRDAGVREGYLVTSDADPSVGNYGISLFWLRRLLQESPVQQRIIWLDCCHSGELLNFLEADPGAHEGTDRLLMAASREYEPAYEALTGTHSVFTSALLSALNPHRIEGGIVNSYHLIKGVSEGLKGEIQQPLFESSGSEIVLTRATHASTFLQASPKTALERLRQISYLFCPYRGTAPFEEAHTGFFFGRDDLITQLVSHLKHHRFCALVGASSSGKTSVLQAGLIPQLRQGVGIPGSESWSIHTVEAGSNPLSSLALAFIDDATTKIERAEHLQRATTLLQNGGKGLVQLIQASAAAVPTLAHPPRHTVLIVDQFEVLLGSQGAVTDEQQQLIRCLLEALQEPDIHLSIVIGLRSDYLHQIGQYPELAALVQANTIWVRAMSYEQLKDTIVKPAQKIGLEVDTNLVYTLLLDILGAPGELPLLQKTLLELWRFCKPKVPNQAPRLTLEAYVNMGGVRQTLEQAMNMVFHTLPAAEQVVAKRILTALCQLGEGTEDGRRRVVKQELVNATFSAPQINGVLEKLIAAKLVVADQTYDAPDASVFQCALPQVTNSSEGSMRAGLSLGRAHFIPANHEPLETSGTIEVVHEALIRHSPLIQGWLAQERDILRYQRRLEQMAWEWHQAGCPHHLDYMLSHAHLDQTYEFLQQYGDYLSNVAQRYILTSRQLRQKSWVQQWALRMLVPVAMVAGVSGGYVQHWISTTQQSSPLLATSFWDEIPLENSVAPSVQPQDQPSQVSMDQTPNDMNNCEEGSPSSYLVTVDVADSDDHRSGLDRSTRKSMNFGVVDDIAAQAEELWMLSSDFGCQVFDGH